MAYRHYTPEETPTRPMGVTITALFFMMGGLYAAYGMFTQWLDFGTLRLNIFVFTFFVGFGLFRGSAMSRMWAKFWLALLSGLLTFSVIYCYQTQTAPYLSEILGVAPGSSMFLLTLGSIWILLLLPAAWVWRALTSGEANQFFDYEP